MSVEYAEWQPVPTEQELADALARMGVEGIRVRPPVDRDDRRRIIGQGLQRLGVIFDAEKYRTASQSIKPCDLVNPELFFPERENETSTAVAKKICKLCVFQDECIKIALDDPKTLGVWAGTNSRERKKLHNKPLRVV